MERYVEKKNRSITKLLDSVLEFIIRAYKKAMEEPDEWEKKAIFFETDINSYEELQVNNVHKLFNKIYNQMVRDKFNSITIKYGGTIIDFIKEEDINRNWDGIDKVFEKQDELNIVTKTIESSFFEESIKKKLLAHFDILALNKSQIYQHNVNEFVSKLEIRKYVSSYYNFLGELIENNTIKDVQVKNGIIRPLLLLGKDATGDLTLYSPIVLNNVEKMYLGVINFYDILFSSLQKDGPIPLEVAYMYKSILIAKTQRIFRWYIPDENKYRFAAVPSKPYGEQQDMNIIVDSKPLEQCNSYEGVGELRLAEKIIEAYLDFKGDEFYVALVGDINGAVEDLVDYVKRSIKQRGMQQKKIVYSVYSRNSNADISDACIIWKSNEYDTLLKSATILQKVISENELVFLLDCIDLYEEMVVEEETNIQSAYMKFLTNDYNKYHDWADTPENIFLCNPLDDFYQCLTSYVVTGQFGLTEKNANQRIIRYLENMVGNEKEYKTVYVYVSDLKAFQNIYCKQQYYMRIEQYNEKKIGIIRFSTKVEENLKNRDSGIIVLSVWQIIKHIALEDRVDILNKICENTNTKFECYELHNMYIGLDYSDWQNEVSVYYSYDEEIINQDENCNKFMEYFIDNIFLKIFRRQGGSIYQQYCKNVIISFLYGDAKSIEDILFVHLLKWGKVRTENFKREPQNQKKDRILDERNCTLRFSNKRLYDLAMQCYDVAFTNMMEDFNITQLFKEDGKSKQEFMREIAEACVNIGYLESSLFINCRE